MEDYFEIIIFLLFAAFSLLSRFLNPKKKKPPVRNPQEQQPYEIEDIPEEEKPVVAQAPKRKPVSFEDILREMMGETTSTQREEPTSRPQRKSESIKKKAQPVLKKAQQSAKKAKRITDKISLEDTGKRIKPIEIEEQKNTVAQEVAEALKTPRNAREAIILSEIINRKHF